VWFLALCVSVKPFSLSSSPCIQSFASQIRKSQEILGFAPFPIDLILLPQKKIFFFLLSLIA